MKFATIQAQDGAKNLALVSNDNLFFSYARTTDDLIHALEYWDEAEPDLQKESDALNAGGLAGVFDEEKKYAPLPRSYQFLDGSAYLSHVKRTRKARGAEIPEKLFTDPLMYQGLSDYFLGPYDSVEIPDEDMGIDFEGEVAVVTDFVPMGTSALEAREHIKLVLLVNDISLRGVIKNEIKKGFGFVQGKPASACASIAVTPDELGNAWDGQRLHASFVTYVNNEWFGSPRTNEMHFGFPKLIAHAARTRHLSAGTIIGSGTVSNEDPENGFSCIVEKRMEEIIQNGKPGTPFLRFGDSVHMYACDLLGRPLNALGEIYQTVVKYRK